MEVSGVTLQTISDAPVLHFNGERKPWGTNPFAEYVRAMGYWGQNLTGLPQQKSAEPIGLPKPLNLVVLLSGPRTGTEWLAKVMADDGERVCGSIDDRTAPHPESLMPYDVACDNATQIPCLSWHIVGPTNTSCDLRLMCQWRYVLSAARGISVTPSGHFQAGGSAGAAYERAWHKWGKHRSSTEVFEGYLRRMMRVPTSAPELPCRCEHKQHVLFLKFFLGWLERPRGAKVGLDVAADYPFLRRFVEPGSPISDADRMDVVDARQVFKRLNARIIYLYREPIAQYLSIQRGRRSELRGSGTAWHCFEVNQSKCPAKPKTAGDDRLSINVRDAGFFVTEALRLQKQARMFEPEFTSTFEDCVANATQCVDTIYRTLELPARIKPVLAARVSSSLNVVRNLDELQETLSDIAAGNWTAAGRKKRIARSHPPGWTRPNGTRADKGGKGVGGGQKASPKPKVSEAPKPRRNVSFDAAVKAAKRKFGGDVHVGDGRCPRLRTLSHPAYPLFAQIHRNRLAGMMVNPSVLGSLSLICGASPAPSAEQSLASPAPSTEQLLASPAPSTEQSLASPAPSTEQLLEALATMWHSPLAPVPVLPLPALASVPVLPLLALASVHRSRSLHHAPPFCMHRSFQGCRRVDRAPQSSALSPNHPQEATDCVGR